MDVSPVQFDDLPAVRSLIAEAIRASVARSDDEAGFLVADVEESLAGWRAAPENALHLKCAGPAGLAGVLLVKDYWNLVNLFVAPARQGHGIGRRLLTVALEACRSRSPRGALLVNSSSNAVGFYARMGFVQTGPGRERPGGCVPLRYDFHPDQRE